MPKRARDEGAGAAAPSGAAVTEKRGVVVVRAPGGRSAAPPIEPNTSLLEAFTYPLGAAAFTQRFFRRKAVAFLGAGAGRITELLEEDFAGGDVRALAEATASERLHVWLKPLVAAAAGGAKGSSSSSSSSSTSSSSAAAAAADAPPFAPLDSLKLDDAGAAMTAHAAGASLYFQSSKGAAAAYVPAMSECLGQSFSGYYDSGLAEHRGEIEVFVSRAGHTTAWHYDFQENFTLQLRGTKRWRLVPGGAHSVLRGATPHFRSPADVVEMQAKAAAMAGDADFAFWPGAAHFAGADEVELAPGDALYFPSGLWHEVTATSDSLSINISLSSLTWAEAGAGAVRHLLTRDGGWRQMITTDPRAALPAAAGGAAGEPAVAAASVDGGGKRKGGAAAAAASSSSSSSSASSAGPAVSHGGAALPPALHSHVAGLLGRLRAAVACLRPEHLVTPASLLSLRWGGVPRVPGWLLRDDGSSGGAAGGDDDADSEAGGGSSDGEEEDDSSHGADDDECCSDDGCGEGGSGGGGHMLSARRQAAHLRAVYDAAARVVPASSPSPGDGDARGGNCGGNCGFLVLQAGGCLQVVVHGLVPTAATAAPAATAAAPSGVAVSVNPLAVLLRQWRDVDRHVAAQAQPPPQEGAGATAGADATAWINRLLAAVAAAPQSAPAAKSGKKASGGKGASPPPAAAAASSAAADAVFDPAWAPPGESLARVRWEAFVAHVNAGNDDLASASRVVLHVPVAASSGGSSRAAPQQQQVQQRAAHAAFLDALAAATAGDAAALAGLPGAAPGATGAAGLIGATLPAAACPPPLLAALRFAGVLSAADGAAA
jgi:hypothetical protein